jgi:adenine-specific DNA-methyltransferase
MPSLNWIGKEKIVNHDKEVPFRLLKKVEKYSLGKDSENLIIEGDNLEALKALMPYYIGQVKCIYIDPPYNTGNESWVYNDNVNAPKIKEWFKKEVKIDDLTRHDKWLCMMYPRLKLLRDLLRDDGVIFISIDDNEHCHLKIIMDEIFGSENFLANFMWKRKKEISNDSKNVSIQGEYVVSYSKTQGVSLVLEELSEEYINSSYSDPTKEFPLGKWRPVPLTVSKGLSGGGYTYKIKAPAGKIHERIWAYPENSFKNLLEKQRVYFGKDKNGIPQRVIYDFESKGKPTTNYWDNIATNKEGKKEIIDIFGDNLFNTPKPVELIKKIIKLSTDKDSLVLDSFAGSGTTADAVMQLNKEEKGSNRKFILIELEKEIAQKITSERVRRVSKGLNGHFSYEVLSDPLFNANGTITEEVSYNAFAQYIYFTETHTNLNIKEITNPKIGEHNENEYYLIYKKPKENLLDKSFLKNIKKNKIQKVVYADKCVLSDKVLEEYGIVFKQIPYEVKVY